jgi:hypothetical protein
LLGNQFRPPQALDDALFEQPLQAPRGSQFRQVAIGALIKRARARCAADTRRLSVSCPPFARCILT